MCGILLEVRLVVFVLSITKLVLPVDETPLLVTVVVVLVNDVEPIVSQVSVGLLLTKTLEPYPYAGSKDLVTSDSNLKA